ncbi:MAG: GNAT family protein [Actinomycetota bacterium]|nr:GNAT family protein [Actinomycetota bacterium]
MPTEIRPVGPDDADELAALLTANRDFLSRWEPTRPDTYFTPAGQRALIEDAARSRASDRLFPYVILADGELIGRITLSNVIRWNFQSCNIGYWVSERHNRRGHATDAVRQVCRVAFDELGLHRVEAGTLPTNAASQRVLVKTGFTKLGIAPKYLKIAEAWEDHILFQRIADDG